MELNFNLKLYDFVLVPGPIAKPEVKPEVDDLFLKALDGFVLVLSSEGDMVYISANVKNYLGIAQVFDYSNE